MPNTTSPQLTSYCYASYHLCELCGGPGSQVVVRGTTHGPACMDLCPRCQKVAEPIPLRTATAANEHREHITRAKDRGELQ